MTSSFPASQASCELVFPLVVLTPKSLEFSLHLIPQLVLGTAKPIVTNAVPTVVHNFLAMEHQIILPETGEHHKVSPFVIIVVALVIQPIIAIHATLGYPSPLETRPGHNNYNSRYNPYQGN